MGKLDTADSQQSRRILVADETAGGRALLRAILELDGHFVCEAKEAAKLLGLARSFDPHLVILDLEMSKIDAYAMVKSLRRIKHPDHLPLIALSPAATQTFPEKIVAAGFSSYLVKPISPYELRSCISVLLRP